MRVNKRLHSPQVPETSVQGDINVTDPITAAQVELSLCKENSNKLVEEVSNLKRSALTFPRNSNWKSERVQIYYMAYGGQFSWNDDLARNCIQHAENGWQFSFDNRFFGWDPIPGCHKMGAIVYRYHDSGEMKCLVKREGEAARFDPL